MSKDRKNRRKTQKQQESLSAEKKRSKFFENRKSAETGKMTEF